MKRRTLYLAFISIFILSTTSITVFSSETGGNVSFSSNSPNVEILYPQNGSIIYTRYSNISVKFSDDNGLKSIHLNYGGEDYQYGCSWSFISLDNKPINLHYENMSLQGIRPGYVLVEAIAYDMDGNIGMDSIIFFYNDTNDTDLNSPEIEILYPGKGIVSILGNILQKTLDINKSIVIGKFEVIATIKDIEWHLQNVKLYIDNEIVYEEKSSDGVSFNFISWDCDRILIGMHEIKIVAIDSFNNSAMEKLGCFVFNIF